MQNKFRFPYSVPTQLYAGGMYLDKLGVASTSDREMDELPVLWRLWSRRKLQSKTTTPERQGTTTINAIIRSRRIGARRVASQNGCSTVEAFLSELRETRTRSGGSICRHRYSERRAPSPRVRIEIKSPTKSKTVESVTSHHQLSYPTLPQQDRAKTRTLLSTRRKCERR